MCKRRGHLAHRHQSRRELHFLFLLADDFGRGLAKRDVGGDLQPHGAPVDPSDLAHPHVVPAAADRVLHLARLLATRAGGQLRRKPRMTGRIRSESFSIGAVCKKQLRVRDLAGHHRHHIIERLQHRREAIVCSGKCVADPARLGDVGHRGHPADLHAGVVDQRRHVHASIEATAVGSLHPGLEAGRVDLALQHPLQLRFMLVRLVRRPVRVGCAAADQLSVAPSAHLREGLIHVADHTQRIDHAQTGGQRVLHRAAQRGFRLQHPICAKQLGRVAKQCSQGRADCDCQYADDPDERAAGQSRGKPERARLELDTRRQRRQRCRIDRGIRGRRFAAGRGQLVALTDESELVALSCFRCQSVDQQAARIDTGQHHANELTVAQDRHGQRQLRFAAARRQLVPLGRAGQACLG